MLLALVATALAVPPAGTPASSCAPSLLDATISLASTYDKVVRGQLATRFPLYSLRDLWFDVAVRDDQVDTLAPLKMVFKDPNGLLRYETNLVFSPDPKIQEAQYSTFVGIFSVFTAPLGLDHRRHLVGSVPVAGVPAWTYFPNLGNWTVEATLDGVDGTATTTFELY